MPPRTRYDAIEQRIGTMLRAKLLAAGLTQELLARRIGVSYQQIQKYENGSNRVAVSTMIRLAEAFGTTATELVGELEGAVGTTTSTELASSS